MEGAFSSMEPVASSSGFIGHWVTSPAQEQGLKRPKRLLGHSDDHQQPGVHTSQVAGSLFKAGGSKETFYNSGQELPIV